MRPGGGWTSSRSLRMRGIADCGGIVLAWTSCAIWQSAAGFDVLLICDPERLARDSGLQVLMLEESEQCGVRTIFLGAGPLRIGSRSKGTRSGRPELSLAHDDALRMI